MQSRMEIYYQRNAALLDKARKLLETKLDDVNLSTDGVVKVASALGGIVDAENKLLGLNQRQKGKARYRRPMPMVEPIQPILT